MKKVHAFCKSISCEVKRKQPSQEFEPGAPILFSSTIILFAILAGVCG